MTRRATFVLLALATLPGPARAQQLVADLTEHRVEITTGFTGADVTLFGAVEGGGDIVVVVRGPEREAVVRRKNRVAGIWLNTDSVAFAAVPGYYAVLASQPVDRIVPPDLRRIHEIGVDALTLVAEGDVAPADAQAFRAALVADRQETGLYGAREGAVDFLGEKLFRATLILPATVPTGAYSIEVFLMRKGDVAAAQTTPLVIEQSGFEASVNDFALHQALLYGVVAAIAAAMAGWLGSLLFRNV